MAAAENNTTRKHGKNQTVQYQAVEYDMDITATDPATGERKTVSSKRTVHQRNDINLDFEVPAGSEYANGRVMTESKTNRELMQNGQAPFVYVTTNSGEKILSQIELHHSTQEETQKGSVYFTGEERDGSIIEIPSYIHKTHKGILHIGVEGSFRVDDMTGKKSFEAAKYDKFRKKYWKDRLRQLEKIKE